MQTLRSLMMIPDDHLHASHILYEDDDLLILNKQAGIAVQSKDQLDLQAHVSTYVGSAVHPVHRIDQPVTGAVLWAKHREIAAQLGELMRQGHVGRTYLAVVAQVVQQGGSLTHHLYPGRNNRMLVSRDGTRGKKSTLDFKVLGESDHYHLLEVRLHSGRRHQIRCQLGYVGMPIMGDVKYGFRRGNRDRSIHLHSWRMEIPGYPNIMAALPSDPLWDHFATQISASL